MISNRLVPGLRILLALLYSLSAASPLLAEAPLFIPLAKDARAKLISGAEHYIGTPYRYGGADPTGFDCSGLVYRVYAETLGLGTPRTVATLHAFAEPLERNELQLGDLLFFHTVGPYSHVGMYAGDGRFIHAVSDGQRTGVMYSALSEGYWARNYAGAGRLIPPAEYLGLVLSASLGPSFGGGSIPRGFSAEAGAAFRLFGTLELGLEARPEYDAALGVVRIPLVLSLGLDRKLRFFAGPALTLGRPSLELEGATRDYQAGGGLLATAGFSFSPWTFKIAGIEWGLTGELVYNYYVAGQAEVADASADNAARLRAGILLRARWGI